MAKRIVTRIGNVFCVDIDNEFKSYFQYVISDLSYLNSSVIRVFKTRYPIDSKPKIDQIVRDEVAFMLILSSEPEFILAHGIRSGHRQRSALRH